MACTCFEFSDDKKVLPSVSMVDKQQKELFDPENGVRYGIDYHGMKRIGYQGQK